MKTPIRLGGCPAWSESSLCTLWVARDPSFIHADSKDWSDWADAQADLSLRWVHTQFIGFVKSLLKWFHMSNTWLELKTLTNKIKILQNQSKVSRQTTGSSNASKIFRGNGKQCRTWSDCSQNWPESTLIAQSCLSKYLRSWGSREIGQIQKIWAALWQNQQYGYGPSEDSDQPGHRAQWVVKGPSFLHADNEDSDQTGRMPRLIWVFAGRTLTLLVLSRGSLY